MLHIKQFQTLSHFYFIFFLAYRSALAKGTLPQVVAWFDRSRQDQVHNLYSPVQNVIKETPYSISKRRNPIKLLKYIAFFLRKHFSLKIFYYL